MDFRCSINGLAVDAVYTEQNVEEIFLPLLRRLGALQKEKGRRILAMLAAPPGAGKSTLSLFLQKLSENNPDLTPLTAVGMDGFHCYRDYLSAHTIDREGETIPLSRIKGAPETFDLTRLRARIELLRSGADTLWPLYDRTLHDPVEDAILVTAELVLLEGNYLLLDEEGWRELRRLADYTIRIDAPEELLYERLYARKARSGGMSESEVERHVRESDLHNARRVLEHSFTGELNLRLLPDGSYSLR